MKIYRDVIVKGNKIVWINTQLFSSVEGVMAAINERAENAVKLLGSRVEDFNRHPWELCEMKEGDRTVSLTVNRKKEVINDEHCHSILGYIMYEVK